MAETVTLPVRGLRRIMVLGVLTLSGAATGALVGALAGVALGWLPEPSAPVLAAALVATALLDLVGPTAPAIGRQVPLEWGRWFSAPTAAALYGARLGVGPLTILTSWTWWTATVVAGTAGPLAGGVAGVAFHLTRVLVMVVGVTGAADAPVRAALLGRLDRPVWAASAGVTVLLAGLSLA